VGYTEDQSAIANIGFTLKSTKVIGTNLDTTPVFKYSSTFTTNGSGERAITGLEWGGYVVTVTDPSYDVAQACKDIPYALSPGVSEELVLSLAPNSPHSQRVVVVNTAGQYVANASVRLERGGFDETKTSSTCGQVFFSSGLGVHSDYTLTISASGYVTQVVDPVEIDGDEVQVVTLTAL
jgi:hypothetical protein